MESPKLRLFFESPTLQLFHAKTKTRCRNMSILSLCHKKEPEKSGEITVFQAKECIRKTQQKKLARSATPPAFTYNNNL